jgi:hypothetical protein
VLENELHFDAPIWPLLQKIIVVKNVCSLAHQLKFKSSIHDKCIDDKIWADKLYLVFMKHFTALGGVFFWKYTTPLVTVVTRVMRQTLL